MIVSYIATSTLDADTLQDNIDRLQTWEVDWLIFTNYSINQHQLKEVKVPWSNHRQNSVLQWPHQQSDKESQQHQGLPAAQHKQMPEAIKMLANVC